MIEYTVEEIGDLPDYTTSIVSNGNSAIITNTHTSKEKTAFSVKKEWQYNGYEGNYPTSVKVQLFANGEKVGEPVVLNADNQWSYCWTDLDKFKDGDLIEYTVEEIGDLPDYTTSIVSNGNSVVITNIYDPEDPDPEDPDPIDPEDPNKPESIIELDNQNKNYDKNKLPETGSKNNTFCIILGVFMIMTLLPMFLNKLRYFN